MDGAALVAGRLAALPATLATLAQTTGDGPALVEGPVWTTGIGASEGPARWFASALCEAGRVARFVPLSALCELPQASSEAPTLALFSQALSPNARIALDAAARFRSVVLFTAANERLLAERAPETAAMCARGTLIVVRHPPAEEQGTLVRVLGPAAASAAALRTAGLLDPAASALIEAVRSAAKHASEVARTIAPERLLDPVLIAAGHHRERCGGLANLWHEALLRREPPLIDVLGAAHGFLQSSFDAPATLVCLERRGVNGERALFDRFARMWEQERHLVLRLVAELPPALAPFEHLAGLGALLLRAANAHPIVGDSWPGRGRDGPIYDLTERPREGA